MFRIKRLYTFILEAFLPLILATFSVCLFILLMQFLWQHIDSMVGKGVQLSVLGELFFYAALRFIPLALPLSILLASLMTFGNLGEHLELLAMKSSGISLIRIMKPLIVLCVFIAGISFVFQNNVAPPAQQKLYTILYSLKQKSPELQIPKGSFSKEIPGYNLYVVDKTKDGLLLDVMIYNYSDGAANSAVILADSGRLRASEDGERLILTLYHGKSFQNRPGAKSNQSQQSPYMREVFSLKEYLIEHDSNFNLADEAIYANRDISKNMIELKSFVDSVKYETDSIAVSLIPGIRGQVYENTFKRSTPSNRGRTEERDTTYIHDFQLFFDNSSVDQQIRYFENAKSKVDMLPNDYLIRERQQSDMKKQMRSHQVEFYKRFSLSLACLFFFFIGAPLGAIIRKGGLGMPAVLSVVIFLLYFTLDTFGDKLAKTGVLPVWQSVSLSSILLISLGVFFTYKAVNDSVIMNPDAWKDWLQRLTGKREIRNYAKKEVIMNPPDYPMDIIEMENWNNRTKNYLNAHKRYPFYISFWKKDWEDRELYGLIESMENYIEDLKNSDQNLIVGKLMDYPIIQPLRMGIFRSTGLRWFCALCLPIGLIIYFLGLYKIKQTRQDLKTTLKVNDELEKELIKLTDNRQLEIK